MLDLGRAARRIAGITVVPDYDDPARWYALAERPTVVADPEPRLALQVWRGDERAGALVELECQLSPSETQLEAVRAQLLLEGVASPQIVAPSWRAGSVRCVGWFDQTGPTVLSVKGPNLLADARCLISARLEPSFASIFAASLRKDKLPLALIYELEAVGIVGPLAVEVEADLQAMHERLTLAGALTVTFARAEIAATFEQFVRDQLIRVRVLDESGDVTARRAEALRRVGEDLVTRMFSALPPERGPLLEDGSIAPVELRFKLTMRREELAATASWQWQERSSARLVHHASASLIGVLAERAAETFIHTSDPAERAQSLTVVGLNLRRAGLAALEIEVRASQGALTRTTVLTELTPTANVALPERAAYQYRLRARFDPELSQVEPQTSDWRSGAFTMLRIDAAAEFSARRLLLLASSGHEWIDRIEVDARCAGAVQKLSLAPGANRELEFLGASAAPVQLRSRWTGKQDEPSSAPQESVITESAAMLSSPFGAACPFTLVPLPRHELLSLSVELQLEQGEFLQRRTASWDGDDRTPRSVVMRPLRELPFRISYRVLEAYMDGRLVEGPRRDASRPVIVVGGDESSVVRDVEVIALGGGPAGRKSAAIELVLSAGEESTRALIEGSTDRALLALAVAPSTGPWSLAVNEFLLDGEVRSSKIADPSRLVVLPPL